MGLGSTTKGEITGICFQKINTGDVKAALCDERFSPVKWADSPTQPPPSSSDGQQARSLHDRLDLGQAHEVKPQWQEFTDAMAHVKAAMLDRVSTCPVFVTFSVAILRDRG